MRRLIPSLLSGLIALSVAIAPTSRAQEQPQQDSSKSKENFEKDFEKGDEGSFIRKRIEWFHDQRAYPHKTIPGGVRLKALQQLNAKLGAEAAARAHAIPGKGQNQARPELGATWQEIGPQPANTFGLVNSGRVAAVAVDPTNNDVVYAGAAQGGIWKTTDGGNTWTPLTDTQASLAIGSIAIDPENHLTIYVGTGELNNSGDSYYGAGILKSTDGGSTWTQYAGPFAGGANGGARIGGLAVHPTNSSIVLAAVGCCSPNLDSGVYRSADGGMTWTRTGNVSNNQAYNVIFDPTGANAYASFDSNGVYKSTDGGVTWTSDNGTGSNVLPTGSSTERVALAMDPNSSTTLYAGVANTPFGGPGSLYGLYKTTDGGTNWTHLTSTPDYCTTQCWYDNVIAVAPGNSNVVFAGGAGWGSQIFQSLDAGSTWTSIPPSGNIHPDLHGLAFTPDGTVLYVGNDGGMYKINSPTSAVTDADLTSLNPGTSSGTGLATLQFYAGPAIHPTNANIGAAGTQDNGTLGYSGTLAWSGGNYPCGDGARNLYDFTNPNNVLYATCVELSIFKSTNGGASFNSAQNGIGGGDRVNWVAPFTMDPNNAQTLYFGTNFAYQTTNGATNWTKISPDLTAGGTAGDTLVALAVSPLSSNTVYAGSYDGLVNVTTNALSGASASWSNVTGSGSLPNRSITALAADPYSATTAYVTFSGFSGYGDNLGHVFMTTNTGSSWTDISDDLPNTPVNDIVVDPTQTGTIYVGTDVGVFYTTNSGISWGTLVTGLPRVAVLGLAFQSASHTLWAATHGRSMWSTSVASITPIPGVTSISPTSAAAGSAAFTLTVNGSAFNSGSIVQWNGADLATTFVSDIELRATVPAGDLTAAGTNQVTVINTGSAASNSATFSVNDPVPSASSLSPMNATAGGSGFTLTVNGGNFVNGASVLWGGSSRTTTFVSSAQVTAAILSTDIASAGMVSVTVSNPAPGGGPSNALTFTIDNPVPAVTTTSPVSKTVGGATFTLTVNGSNFVKSASAINWNGSPLATTFVSSAKLTASVSASLVTTAGTVPVTVVTQTPGGGTSNAATFTIDNLKPTITSISPTSATAGGATFTLTVNGTNFLNTSVVNWNGAAAATTYASKTKLTAQITSTDIASPGTIKVTVTNPAPGGGTSASKTFTIDNPVPSLLSISPTSATAGGATFTLTVNGSNFVAGSKVQWNATKPTTHYVSSTQLTATITAADIKTAGTASVTVFNPTPGGGTSGAKSFTIDNAIPTLTKLTPSSATAGGAAFTLTVTGTKFVSGSVVNWNGSPRTTTYVSATSVKAAILSSDITSSGTAQVSVTNPAPGGGTSATPLTFTINP
jgi:photosystem II stability/assembly factor-like uncharacterized protein